MKFVWTKMPERDEECQCCGRLLKNECVMLELQMSTHTYSQDGKVLQEDSQGWFPFGKTCAERILKNGGRE
jgi:hypothetical protein